eukprot:scaffold22950_cov80-Skeletonema_marinoi.AAC.2
MQSIGGQKERQATIRIVMSRYCCLPRSISCKLRVGHVVFEVALREETRRKGLQAASKDMIQAGKRHVWRVSPSLVRTGCTAIIEGHARQSGAFQIV